jgi:hypothetical protein
MVSTKAFQEVPRTVKDWERARKAAGLQRSSINSFLGMHSGSEMTQGQYLLMKVLYPKRRPITSFNPATYSLTQDLQAATALLNASSQFQAFLNAIRVLPHTNLGSFAIPRMNQLLIQPPPATSNVQVQTTNPPTSRNLRSRCLLESISLYYIERLYGPGTESVKAWRCSMCPWWWHGSNLAPASEWLFPSGGRVLCSRDHGGRSSAAMER